MKRISEIYSKIYDIENLEKAHMRASKGKSNRKDVQEFNINKDFNLLSLQNSLKNKTYKIEPTDYVSMTIKDKGKTRIINKVKYNPHRIVQWAILLQIQDILLKSFTRDTYASMPKRGIHSCLKKLRRDLKNKDTTYCLKLDIEKYFDTIDHEINKALWHKKFKDKDFLLLIDNIVDSYSVVEGDKKGIPIGTLFSQWNGNFYLSGFDHWIKEVERVEYYYRYMDDVVILHKDKDYLHKLFRRIENYLRVKLKLNVKGNWQVFPVDDRGIDFLGYRFYHTHIGLRKRIKKNLSRKCRKINKQKHLSRSNVSTIGSYIGWLKWCDGKQLESKYIEPILNKYEKENK